MPDDCLGLFAKYWQPGRVKTRLAETLGAEQAAAAYQAFVRALVERLASSGDDRILAFAPADRHSEFEQLSLDAWRLEPQATGDLGQRMEAFFRHRLREGCQRAVLLGTDSPNVPLAHIDQAFEELHSANVVLGPSEDGGYYLVGISGKVPPIFTQVPWSTPDVWQSTVELLQSAKIHFSTLPTWYDVDNSADYERLVSELQRTAGHELVLDRLLTALR